MSFGDRDCAALLAWAAPRLGLREAGFARVRAQVRKRIARRIGELGLPGAAGYRLFLESHPEEWAVLDRLCRITISRFWRDAPAFDLLAGEVLPGLIERARARGARTFRIWSLACASGEEPYSIALAWHLRLAPPDLALELLASDASAHMVARAREATYPSSIFHELPSDLRIPLNVGGSPLVTIPPHLRAGVVLQEMDVRVEQPPGPFDLILCRNLVFTYFSPALQSALLARFHALTVPGGALMIGKKESLPVEQSCYISLRAGVFLAR